MAKPVFSVPILPRAFVVTLFALLGGCGGGADGSGGTGAGGGGTTGVCANNVTAPIDGAIADVRQYFGGQTLIGTTCRPGCSGGGNSSGGAITLLADGSGGNVNGNMIFTITSVCKSSAYPDRYFVSGVYSDSKPFINALFLYQVPKVQDMSLSSLVPADWRFTML